MRAVTFVCLLLLEDLKAFGQDTHIAYLDLWSKGNNVHDLKGELSGIKSHIEIRGVDVISKVGNIQRSKMGDQGKTL